MTARPPTTKDQAARTRHQWFYETAPASQVGLMVCTACHKPIADGQFRYRETEEAYLPQHRACSETAPQWAVLDVEAAQRKALAKRRYEAAQAFVREWGVTDLNDILEDTRVLA